MHSALYTGHVRHRRFVPRAHRFRYALFMVYLDLAELDHVFHGSWLWSTTRWAPAQFRRSDHLGDPAQPLDEAVRDLVAAETGHRPRGPIRLLTHLRYFGYVINPVSVYYCFVPDETSLEAVVLEVNNTPWGERHCYVLHGAEAGAGVPAYSFEKAFHVSPFMTGDHTYHARIGMPDERLLVHLENWRGGERLFDATLTLRRRPMTGWSLARQLAVQPLMTVKVAAAIYFEALRLWLKRIPYVPHPSEARAHEEISGT